MLKKLIFSILLLTTISWAQAEEAIPLAPQKTNGTSNSIKGHSIRKSPKQTCSSPISLIYDEDGEQLTIESSESSYGIEYSIKDGHDEVLFAGYAYITPDAPYQIMLPYTSSDLLVITLRVDGKTYEGVLYL